MLANYISYDIGLVIVICFFPFFLNDRFLVYLHFHSVGFSYHFSALSNYLLSACLCHITWDILIAIFVRLLWHLSNKQMYF